MLMCSKAVSLWMVDAVEDNFTLQSPWQTLQRQFVKRNVCLNHLFFPNGAIDHWYCLIQSLKSRGNYLEDDVVLQSCTLCWEVDRMLDVVQPSHDHVPL